jgi:hypothetical protein
VADRHKAEVQRKVQHIAKDAAFLYSCFQILDEDGDNLLKEGELRQWLSCLTAVELQPEQEPSPEMTRVLQTHIASLAIIAPTARVANRSIPGVVTGCDTPVDRRGMELDEFLEDVIVTSLKKRARRGAAARAVAAAETAAVAVGKIASGDEQYTGMYPYLEHSMRWLLWRCLWGVLPSLMAVHGCCTCSGAYRLARFPGGLLGFLLGAWPALDARCVRLAVVRRG